MPSTGVENARTNDMYLNSNTSDTYMCVFPGDANTAQWAWSGNIKGNTGNPGPAGPTGSVDENTPILFTQAMLKENITSGEAIAIMFGKIAKWFNDFGTAAWASVVNNGTTFSEGTVLDGRMGKALTDSIGTLTDLDTTEKTSLVGAINELTAAIAELNGKLGSTEIERHAITLISEEYYELNPDYSWYVIKNGICYVQIQIRCKSPKASSDNYYPLSSPLPSNAMGDYLYDKLTNLIEIRISGSGAVRVATGNIGEWATYFKAYPIADD